MCRVSTIRRVVHEGQTSRPLGEGWSDGAVAAAARAKPWAKIRTQDLANALRTKGLGCGGGPGSRTDPRWPTLAEVSSCSATVWYSSVRSG